jgi:hypothetical protein
VAGQFRPYLVGVGVIQLGEDGDRVAPGVPGGAVPPRGQLGVAEMRQHDRLILLVALVAEVGGVRAKLKRLVNAGS